MKTVGGEAARSGRGGRAAWVQYRDKLDEDDPRRAAVEDEIHKLDRRSAHQPGVIGRQGSEQATGSPIGGNGLVRSQQDQLVVGDLNEYAHRGWHMEPGNAVVLTHPANDLWAHVLQARKVNFSKLSAREIESLGLVCFGEWLEFAHLCWQAGTVESLQAMLSMVHQQALEGLLLSKKVAMLMRWTKYGNPVSHKNAQQYVRQALKKLELKREELLVLLGRGILDRVEWTMKGRWAGAGAGR